MPRKKVPIKATPAQNREKYRKAKEHQQAARERRASARAVDVCAGRRIGVGGTGRPFGTTGGYWKPWMKRVVGAIYTDVDFVRDFLLLSPKERLMFLCELDPKNLGEGSPEEVATRIKAVLDAIQNSVPAPKQVR
jgi:hypothetical protein